MTEHDRARIREDARVRKARRWLRGDEHVVRAATDPRKRTMTLAEIEAELDAELLRYARATSPVPVPKF